MYDIIYIEVIPDVSVPLSPYALLQSIKELTSYLSTQCAMFS